MNEREIKVVALRWQCLYPIGVRKLILHGLEAQLITPVRKNADKPTLCQTRSLDRPVLSPLNDRSSRELWCSKEKAQAIKLYDTFLLRSRNTVDVFVRQELEARRKFTDSW